MSTLREKIAQAIRETIDKTSYYVWTRPTESDPYVLAVDGDVDAGAIADAIMPLIRQAQAEAKVEAWGQAKELIRVSDEDDRLEHTMHGGNLGPEWEQRTAGMNQAIEVIDYLMKPHVAAYRVGEGQKDG